MTWRLSEPSTLTFDMNGRDPQAFQLVELATDVHVLRDGLPLFTGRVGSTSHSLDGDGHTVAANVTDTRGMLARRLLDSEKTSTGGDAAVYAAAVLSDAQAGAGGDLRIAPPTFPEIGVPITHTGGRGEPILTVMQEAAGRSTGASDPGGLFDWDITPGWEGRQFQLWRQRGRRSGVFLDHTWSARNPRSSPIASMARSFDPATYANSVVVTGGDSQNTYLSEASARAAIAVYNSALASRGKTTLQGDDLGTPNVYAAPRQDGVTTLTDGTTEANIVWDVNFPTVPVTLSDGSIMWTVGRWEATHGYTDVSDQVELGRRAQTLLQELQQVTPTYTVTLTAGYWEGPEHIWLGDTITIHIDDGSLYEEVALRVTEIAVDLSDDGQETVTLTVGPPAAQPYKSLIEATRRISTLERRR